MTQIARSVYGAVLSGPPPVTVGVTKASVGRAPLQRVIGLASEEPSPSALLYFLFLWDAR